MIKTDRCAIFLACAAGLAACGGGSSDNAAPVPPAPPSTNRSPVISGAPAGTVRVNDLYEFAPVASDPDGDALSFSIQNRPAWMTFEAGSGRLTGIPTASDLGRHEGIVVVVSDGVATTALGAFAVEVIPPPGSTTLRWSTPTINSDGTPLDDLAAYIIYYGQSPTNLDQFVVVEDPLATLFIVTGLTGATWYFALTSYSAEGVEGRRSATVSHAVNAE